MCGFLTDVSNKKAFYFQMEKYTLVQYKDNENYKVIQKINLCDLESLDMGNDCQIILKLKNQTQIGLKAKDNQEQDDWIQFL